MKLNKTAYVFITIITVASFGTLIFYIHSPIVRAISDKYGTGGAVLDVKGIPDVNGNGWPDIVAGSQDNNVYVIDGSTMEKIWSKYIGLDVITVNYIEDISGDAKPEVVIGCESGYLAVINGVNGTIIWDYTTDFYDYNIYRVKVIPDIDGDTISEILIGAWTSLHCLSGYDGNLLWKHEGGGQGHDFTEMPDITGDGKCEVAFLGLNYYLYLYNGTDGAELTNRRMNTYGSRALIELIPDVSGDGFDDLLTYTFGWGTSYTERIHVLSGVSLETIWEINYGCCNQIWDVDHISDITTDGRPEVIIGYTDQVECRDGMDGSSLWNKSLPQGNSDFTLSQRIAVSGSDFVVGCQDGMIFSLHSKNGSLVKNQYSSIEGAVNSIEFIDDATGDSIHDLVVGGNDHYVYFIDFGVMSSDTEPPEIGAPIQVPSKTDVAEDQEVIVSVSVTDAGSGVFEVTLSHSINDGISWENSTMIGQGDIFNGTIPGYPKDTMVRYKIIAYDNVGNHAVKEMPYFVYIVIPEFSSMLILPLFMIAALLAVIVYKRKHFR